MRCPKCGYISFDGQESCAKCGRDVSQVSTELQGTGIKIEAPNWLPSAMVAEEEDRSVDLIAGDEEELEEGEEAPPQFDLEADSGVAADAEVELEEDGEPDLSSELDTVSDVESNVEPEMGEDVVSGAEPEEQSIPELDLEAAEEQESEQALDLVEEDRLEPMVESSDDGEAPIEVEAVGGLSGSNLEPESGVDLEPEAVESPGDIDSVDTAAGVLDELDLSAEYPEQEVEGDSGYSELDLESGEEKSPADFLEDGGEIEDIDELLAQVSGPPADGGEEEEGSSGGEGDITLTLDDQQSPLGAAAGEQEKPPQIDDLGLTLESGEK